MARDVLSGVRVVEVAMFAPTPLECTLPIAENDRIIVLLGAANRDPEVFRDPDQLDIARDPNPHLAFGAGLYHCLGIHLARMEMQIALDAIVRHMPVLRLVDEPVWRPTWMMRGLASLPVESRGPGRTMRSKRDGA